MAAWVALIVAAWRHGLTNRDLWKVRAAPLAGSFDRHITSRTFLVAVLGLALARWLPGWFLRLSWRRVLLLAMAGGLAWGLALAMPRDAGSIESDLGTTYEYPAVVEQVDRVGVGTFVDTFTTERALRTYPIHVQGHPLGVSLLFVGLDRVGLGGARGAAVFLLAASSTAVVAVLLAVREVAGEGRARRAAPFLVLMPGLVWWVTSADALFATVGAWGIALVALACRPDLPSRRRVLLAVGAGVVWGIGIHLSYGLAPLVIVAVAVAVARRRWSVLGWAAVGGAAVVAAFVVGGFWWFDGLAATKVRYVAGISRLRPQWYFGLLGNPAAFSLALGPAAWVAIVRVRDRGLMLLAFAALGAVAVANLSGLSKAEVERIWLPFVPWVLVLAAGLAVGQHLRTDRGSWSPGWPALASWLLVGQVLVAVTVQSLVKTTW